MIRVPSLIHAGEFQSLKIQDMTFVAYRNQDPPLKNEVFFEEHAVIFVLEGEKKFVSPTQTIHVRKGHILFIRRGYYLMQETIDSNYRSLVFFFNEKLLKEFVGQHLEMFTTAPRSVGRPIGGGGGLGYSSLKSPNPSINLPNPFSLISTKKRPI